MFKYEEEITSTYEVLKVNNENLDAEEMKFFIELSLSAYALNYFKKYYDIDSELHLVRTDNKIETMKFDCTDCDYEEAGLYFIGMCGFNPLTEEKYYLVKVGSASNIKKRVRQYLGMNPMIYNNGNILPLGNQNKTVRETLESNCHRFLEKRAYAKAAHAEEWFYVSRDTYLELCEMFSDANQFKKVAQNKMQ